jgi:hypothetical protein
MICPTCHGSGRYPPPVRAKTFTDECREHVLDHDPRKCPALTVFDGTGHALGQVSICELIACPSLYERRVLPRFMMTNQDLDDERRSMEVRRVLQPERQVSTLEEM